MLNNYLYDFLSHHFHDDFLTRVCGAINIVYQRTCILPFGKLFVVQEGEVGYHTFAFSSRSFKKSINRSLDSS